MIRKFLFVLVFLYILCSCSTSNSIQERTQKMIDLKINKDICLGRFLFPLSDDFKITSQSYNFYWGRNDIKQKKQTKEEFTHEVNKLRDQLKGVKHDGEDPSLYSDITLKNGDRLLFSWERAFGSDLYHNMSYAWRNGITYIFESDVIGAEKLETVKKRLPQYLTNLRYRAPDDIPTTAGFCFENGFIADDGKNYQNEEVRFHFSLKSHPDLNFHFSITPRTLEDEPSLLDRVNNAKVPSGLKSFWENDLKFVEKGKYNTKYLDGERVFANLPIQDDFDPQKTGRFQDFTWENQGIYHDVLKPSIVLHFLSGNHDSEDHADENTSLSDDEAVDLFNQIVNKIRPRPAKGMPLERW